MDNSIEPLEDFEIVNQILLAVEYATLGYIVRAQDKEGRHSYEKEIISDPQLQRTKISASPDLFQKLKVYVLCSTPQRRRLE